jgi:hypothetical protein
MSVIGSKFLCLALYSLVTEEWTFKQPLVQKNKKLPGTVVKVIRNPTKFTAALKVVDLSAVSSLLVHFHCETNRTLQVLQALPNCPQSTTCSLPTAIARRLLP